MLTLENYQHLESLAFTIGEKLLVEQHMLATAESCTGGWVAQSLTAVPGSSRWFDCALVTYSNASKQQMLGVSEEVLQAQGAVSEVVAAKMAEGALKHSRAQWALSITGIAGPDGGSQDKPVGTVCFGWSHDGSTETETCIFSGDRAEVRFKSVEYVLKGLIARISNRHSFA